MFPRHVLKKKKTFPLPNKENTYMFFNVCLTLGLMANEVQGDMCGEVLRQADCGAQGARSCGALCGYLKRGTVHCVRVSDGKLACFCVFKCPS